MSLSDAAAAAVTSPSPGGRLPFWLLPHLFALDAPAVAVVWQRFLGWAFGVPVPISATVVLAAVVWGIYLVDRVLDGQANRVPKADRHLFAARYARPLLVLGVSAFGTGLVVAITLPRPYILVGLLIAAAVGCYLLVVHFARSTSITGGWKEFLVGVVFAGGVAVPLLAEADTLGWVPAVVSFGLCCWWNCRLIDRWEVRRPTGRTLGRVIGFAAAVIGYASPLPVWLALISALVLLLLVDAAVPVIGVRVARVLVDVVLLTPLLVWPIS